ncbi:Imm1 family immunity protein [Actinokineospora globicatena]|uniref:Imm1 family immunity protein n=1 Tax=Actinokineospora globicatena TaxID=103729 RepID=UPI0020A52A7A|nr:Imm1 family immunity protein [Actinokineospora globicatena]MCP2304726.1 hypothetical protein [Actinokineospora globicatena]GLW77898.1 hypothetical protein Aglo01_23800 [Actinokineospora globicatena]GLW85435.1 hypothetical protein Aglo02_30750 [Actinokineospora globicatena]
MVDDDPPMIVTATLTTGISRVTNGLRESINLIEEVLETEHVTWETILLIGDHEYRTTLAGPVPNSQFRVSVRPSLGVAALNYTDHDDRDMPIAVTHNPGHPQAGAELIFSGSTGMTFPFGCAVSIESAHLALVEWLHLRRRPTSLQWRPFS